MKTSFLAIFVFTILLTSCQKENQTLNNETTINNEALPKTSDSRLKYSPDKWVSYIQQNKLYVTHIDSGETLLLTTLDRDSIPNRVSLDTMQLSADGGSVLWSVPTVGLLIYDITTDKVDTFYQAGEWFLANPDFSIYVPTNQVWLVDGNGTELVSINVSTRETRRIRLPEAFGSSVSLSADGKYAVLPAGYREDGLERPEYLVVNTTTEEVTKLVTKSELADRFSYVFTGSDSLLVIERTNEIVEYSLSNPTKSTSFITINAEGRIAELHQAGLYVFVLTADETWHAIDTSSRRLVKTLPLDAAFSEMSRYLLHPITHTHFVVEEIVDSETDQYRKLWLSDMLGIKRLLVPEFGRLTLISEED